MSQATFDDDDLFGEAATEMRADVVDSLEAAKAALPDADAIWETDAANVLGVLNGLNATLDPGDAEDHLRDAKKWYTVGERADAFDDASDLVEEIETLEETIETVAAASDQVSNLTATMPQLRSTLEDAAADAAAAGESEPDGEPTSSEEDATEAEAAE